MYSFKKFKSHQSDLANKINPNRANLQYVTDYQNRRVQVEEKYNPYGV